MITRDHTTAGAFAGIFVLTLAAAFALPAAADEPKPSTLVLVSVDGLAAFYYDDPYAKMPNLRRLAEGGARARGLEITFPTVTWTAHTTLLTGATPASHGVIANSVLNRETQQQRTYIADREVTGPEAIQVPTLADAVHDAGGEVGAVNWPLAIGFDNIRWIIPDSWDADIHARYTQPEDFPEQLEAANIPAAELPGWGWAGDRARDRDEAYTDIAIWLLEHEQPELVLLHLIGPDHAQHGHGPYSEQAYDSVRHADEQVGRLWQAIEAGGMADEVAVFVASDHGFAPYDQHVRLNVLFAEQGWVELNDEGEVTTRRVWAHSHGGAASIYLLDESISADDVRDVIADVAGIESILEPSDFVKMGLPAPEDNVEQGHLMLSAEPGYVFNNAVEGEVVVRLDTTRGAHGHRGDRRWMHASLFAFGAGIAEGVTINLAQDVDVAPTIGYLLGLDLPAAEGSILSLILVD